MKILKKIVSVFVVSVMLLGITGCDEKERDNQEGQANEVSNNMLYVGCEKTDDDRKHYFVAGNGETKVYSGYKTMGDFINGVSLVEVDTEEFTGNMLIDIEENVIFKYKGIEKKDEADIEIYIVTDDEGKKGIYSLSGKVISECQYEDIFINDIDVSGMHGVIVAKKEDTSLDIYSCDGSLICSVPAGFAEEGYGYDGVSVDGYRDIDILEVKYGNVAKLYDIKSSKELSVNEYEDYSQGMALTEEKLVFYNDNFGVVKEIKYPEEGKEYKVASRYSLGSYYSGFYYASYDTDISWTKDMAHETFIKAFDKLDSLKEGEKFKSWICQIANRLCLNYIKRSKIIEFESIEQEDDTISIPNEKNRTPEDISVDNEVAQILLKAIDKIPKDQKICVFMYYYENLSVKEIANHIGCSENTVRGKLRYANINLQKYIENLGDEGIKLRCIGVLPFIYVIFNMERSKTNIIVKGAELFGKGNIVKAGMSIKLLTGIISGAVATVGAVIIAIVIGTKGDDNNIGEKNSTTILIQESADQENVDDEMQNEIKEVRHFKIDNISNPVLLGKYVYYKDLSQNRFVLKDIANDIVVKEMPTGSGSRYRDCGDSVIILCQKEEYIEICIFDKQGKYLYEDTMYIGNSSWDYAYMSREYSIDDLMLSKSGDFVYLSYNEDKYVLKSFNIPEGKIKYEVNMEKGVVASKNEYYIVYSDMVNNVIEIIDIANGNSIAGYSKDDVHLQAVRLLGEHYAICETQDSDLISYKRFDINGNMDLSVDFNLEEKVSMYYMNGIEIAHGLNYIPMQREIDGVKQKGIFRSDMTPVVDFSEVYQDYEPYSTYDYAGEYSDVYPWFDSSYIGMIFLNNGETVIEAGQMVDAYGDTDIIVALNNEDTKQVINKENGCVIEVPATADIYKIWERSGNDYSFAIVDADQYDIYDKNGKYMFKASVPIYDNLKSECSLSHLQNSNYYVYNDINKNQNKLYIYDVLKGEERDITTKESVIYSFMVNEENVVYSTKGDDNTYKYVIKNINTGEERELFVSEFGILYSCTDYGFIIGSESRDWSSDNEINCEIVSY